MSDRGVSEALGFVLVFALVTGTIGVVYATGITGLHDAQHAERVNNVERAFDVLADNLEDLHRSGAPSRATEVKLAGGALRPGDPVDIQIEVEEVGNVDNNDSHSVSLEPIVYEDESGAELIYSGGAVLRSSPHGTVMLSEPGWLNSSDRSVIPLVSTYGTGGGVAGDGAVLIVAQRGSRTLLEPFEVAPGSTARVNVTVSSPRAVVWRRYLEGQGFEAVDADVDDGSVTYRFYTERLYVTKTDVEVSFNR